MTSAISKIRRYFNIPIICSVIVKVKHVFDVVSKKERSEERFFKSHIGSYLAEIDRGVYLEKYVRLFYPCAFNGCKTGFRPGNLFFASLFLCFSS